MPRPRLAALSCLAATLLPLSVVAQVPSPKEFLGHEIGADYQLCNYTDLVRYWRTIEQRSDRLRLVARPGLCLRFGAGNGRL